MRLVAVAKTVVGCALLAGFLAPGTSLAEPPGPPRGQGPHAGRFIEQHAERIGLDAETLEAIQKIVDESRERGEGLRVELRDAHEEMRNLLSREGPDESAVMQQAEGIGELELEERKNRIRATLQIRALLTPEQREELIRIREESGRPWRHGPLGACRVDVERICSGAQRGHARVQCLSEHWDELSEACRSVFEGRARRGFGRRR